MSITDVLGESYNALKNNLIMVVPYILFALLNGVIAVIIGIIVFLPAIGSLSAMHMASTNGTAVNSTASMSYLLSFAKDLIVPLIAFVIIYSIVSLLVNALMTGMFISMGRQALKGKVNLGAAWADATSRYMSMLGVTILEGLIYIIIIGIISIPFILAFVGLAHGLVQTGAIASILAGGNLTNTSAGASLTSSLLALGAAFILYLVVILVVALILAVYLYQAYTVVILENKRAVDAIKRSMQIGKQNFWSILGLLLLVGVISILLSLALDIFNVIPYAGSAIAAILHILLALFLTPWIYIIMVSFYNNYVGKGQKSMSTPAKPAPVAPKKTTSKKSA